MQDAKEMQYSEEWKSLFPISSMPSPPLLIQNSSSLGPLFFNPVPESLSLLSSSSNLSPPILPPAPHISLPGFLQHSTCDDSSVLPTTASAISASINSKDHYKSSEFFLQNRLEPLHCPNNQVFIFYPTGSNLDSVGFFVLSVRDSKMAVDFSSDGSVYAPQTKLDNRIIQLAACPISECFFPNVDDSTCVGFLLACNLYAANWFRVQISGHCLGSKMPALVFLGRKKFKSAMVAHTCWNPHLPGESVILLVNGALFLFEMDSCLNKRFGGKRIRVAWNELGESADSGWFSCEFSWHPRILVVANSKAIYLVDLRFGKCQPSCLLSIDIPGASDLFENDKFFVFSKAGSGGFLYTVASEHWLILCDIRKPLAPVLRWAHHMHKPHYMVVLPLSDLRSIPHDKHIEAYVVILGSFWSNEFNLFCCGRPYSVPSKSFLRNISNFSNSFYAWELPSLFLLGGQTCPCGSCLLRENFLKEGYPPWIEWQQKQELVLGFCILNKGLSSLLPQAGENGGFTVIRLMSTGKLECQQFCASWKLARVVAMTHGEMTPLKDSPLCSLGNEEYEYPRMFRYVKLESLYNHLCNNLAKALFKRFRNLPAAAGVKKAPSEHFQKFMSEKFGSPMSHLSAADIFRDVSMPTTLYEIACRVVWTSLPMNILELGFLDCSEVLGSDQEAMPQAFLAIPDQKQSPPFILRNPTHCGIKSSAEVQSNEIFVGPVCPLPALVIWNEISTRGYSFVGDLNEFSPEAIFARQYKYIRRLTKGMCSLNIGDRLDKKHAVSVEEDSGETLIGSSETTHTSSLFWYTPSAFLDEVEQQEDSAFGERFDTIVAKFVEDDDDDDDIFAGLCPMELKFDFDMNLNKSSAVELTGLKVIKKHLTHWQKGYKPYQDLQTRYRVRQPHC